MFSAPIPGQSLTSEVKNSAWENPPEMSAPEDALLWHLKKLNDPKRFKAIFELLELGLDVVTFTEGILRNAVADGRHSIDVSLIIAPVIHELVAGRAKAAGIDFDEGLEEENEQDQKDLDYKIESNKANKIIKEMEKTGEVNLSPLKNKEEEMTDPEIAVEETKEEPKGLMSRRTA
tara:strand:+ start:1272 stop:1799 length:528 start_codon:yes stop_codon:yes gene_type:complete